MGGRDKRILAIVPARAGSKGLPGKNLMDLGGRPLIAWTIQAVKRSPSVTDFCFTTESEEIAEVARQWGAPVPFMRPEALAQDETSSLAVLLHALNEMERINECRYDIVIYLQPTSPFRSHRVIERGIELLVSAPEDVISAVGVAPVGDSHPWWDLKEGKGGVLEYYVDDSLLPGPRPMRRQELPPAYHFNGSIAVVRRSYFDYAKDPMPVFGDRFLGIVMSRIESVNIETLEDITLARAMLSVYPEVYSWFWD